MTHTFHIIAVSGTEYKLVKGLPKKPLFRDFSAEVHMGDYEDELNRYNEAISSAPFIKNLEVAKSILHTQYLEILWIAGDGTTDNKLICKLNHPYPVDLSGYVVSEPELSSEMLYGQEHNFKQFVTITKEEIIEASENEGWISVESSLPDPQKLGDGNVCKVLALGFGEIIYGNSGAPGEGNGFFITNGEVKFWKPVAAPLESKALEVQPDNWIYNKALEVGREVGKMWQEDMKNGLSTEVGNDKTKFEQDFEEASKPDPEVKEWLETVSELDYTIASELEKTLRYSSGGTRHKMLIDKFLKSLSAPPSSLNETQEELWKIVYYSMPEALPSKESNAINWLVNNFTINRK